MYCRDVILDSSTTEVLFEKLVDQERVSSMVIIYVNKNVQIDAENVIPRFGVKIEDLISEFMLLN